MPSNKSFTANDLKVTDCLRRLNKFFNLWESASQAVVFYLKDDLSTEALQVSKGLEVAQVKQYLANIES
jgi:hypothetical protein